MNILLFNQFEYKEVNLKEVFLQYNSEWELMSAESKDQLLRLVKSDNLHDTIILQLGAIDIGSLDLIEKIRDETDTPIVVISKDYDSSILVKVITAGANDHVEIPFNVHIFIAKLNALLRRERFIKSGEFPLGNEP